MPLQDRVSNVRARLLATLGREEGPVTFVCHSLGGLIVKQFLLDLHQQKDRSPEAAALLNRVTQVVFMATPHTGSRKGTLLNRLSFLAWPSSISRRNATIQHNRMRRSRTAKASEGELKLPE